MSHTVMGDEEWVMKTLDHHPSTITHHFILAPACPA
jgi:hypothetical protein